MKIHVTRDGSVHNTASYHVGLISPTSRLKTTITTSNYHPSNRQHCFLVLPSLGVTKCSPPVLSRIAPVKSYPGISWARAGRQGASVQCTVSEQSSSRLMKAEFCLCARQLIGGYFLFLDVKGKGRTNREQVIP